MMKGVDATVLVRYIVQDDPKQSHHATQFIEKVCSEENPAFINGIVLCELVEILETVYEYPKANIADVLEKILRTRQFYIYQPEILWNSLRDYRDADITFTNCYIAHLNNANECEYTATFDEKAAQLKHLKQLGGKND